MRGALVLLLAAGCAAPRSSGGNLWQVTSQACKEGGQSCHEAIAKDLGLRGQGPTAEAVLEAAEALLQLDLGPWPAEESVYVRRPMLDWLAEQQGPDAGARLYNALALAVEDTFIYEDLKGRVMAYNSEYKALLVQEGIEVIPIERLMLTLAHEAGHAPFPSSHEECDVGGGIMMECDRSWASAYGVEAGTAYLAYTACTEEPSACEEWFHRAENTALQVQP